MVCLSHTNTLSVVLTAILPRCCPLIATPPGAARRNRSLSPYPISFASCPLPRTLDANFRSTCPLGLHQGPYCAHARRMALITRLQHTPAPTSLAHPHHDATPAHELLTGPMGLKTLPHNLVPYRELMALQRPSPVMTVYFILCWRLDLISLYAFGQRDPAYSSSKPNIFSDMIDDGTQWIRRSTGCLCVEFEPSGIDAPPGTLYQPDLPVDAPLVLNNPDFETHAVQILTEDVYQGICRYSLANSHELGLFKQAEVRVGVLAFLPLGVQHKVPGHIVASPSVSDMSVDLYDWGMEKVRRAWNPPEHD
ncbi:hypothetical protein FB45DRAFT_1029654 [Roridomyces roridus]|uniref:Uncharacterized protein n=1 Tax=Roridomyces roridus TaxID=1738132 RepID=A0AAD7BQ13_9AGAR|nr:hypothetical protein FB45DRAFT_1029654 [Roridomyces roridus]